MGSIHALDGRIVICTSLWWHGDNLTKAVFYEPSTDKENECTGEELIKMIELKKLVLHTPQKGRVIR
jgi:hypothetical protein